MVMSMAILAIYTTRKEAVHESKYTIHQTDTHPDNAVNEARFQQQNQGPLNARLALPRADVDLYVSAVSPTGECQCRSPGYHSAQLSSGTGRTVIY